MKIFALIFFLVSSSVFAEPKNTFVLNYSDFGPPSAAYEIIGMDWWQWQSHGDSRPRSYDIKVVV